ncbi:putative phage structural protein [Xanthomonas phage Xp15]|uniref:Putative phage structural protein n=1 Tax=Xanthomonas phage Xp15 TaxID=322855 RepID=Q52PM2_9CAUD|nr:putative phage structural protein [Xanthomonas phage Xp15]AAX84852.1 putative phage structural protein [Xanthomonas phage Xp15]
MKLKFKIGKLEDVAEAYRNLYSQGPDGSYYLDVDGAVDKSKLDEFRDNNVALRAQIEKFKDVDPAKYQELMAEHAKIHEGELIKKGDVEGLVNHRTQTMRTEYEGKLNSLSKNYEIAQRQLETLTIDNVVRDRSIKLGVAPTAVEDVLLRAKSVFRVEEGRPVAKDPEGKIVYGKNGTDPMDIGEWLGGLKDQAPHLFQPSTGSGGNGGNRQAGNGGEKLSAAQKIASGLSSGSTIMQ